MVKINYQHYGIVNMIIYFLFLRKNIMNLKDVMIVQKNMILEILMLKLDLVNFIAD